MCVLFSVCRSFSLYAESGTSIQNPTDSDFSLGGIQGGIFGIVPSSYTEGVAWYPGGWILRILPSKQKRYPRFFLETT